MVVSRPEGGCLALEVPYRDAEDLKELSIWHSAFDERLVNCGFVGERIAGYAKLAGSDV